MNQKGTLKGNKNIYWIDDNEKWHMKTCEVALLKAVLREIYRTKCVY